MSDAAPISGSGAAPRVDGPDAASAAYGFSPSLVSLLNTTGPQADAIRSLRGFVMAQHINYGRRALAICAPSGGVGCSFVAANLAVSLSQIGLKTLLIDGDLRRPAVGGLIRSPHVSGGLVQALQTSGVAFGQCIDSQVLPNFSIMYAGNISGNPQELLASDRFRSLMNYCLREFDVTILDTPPANASSDARRIGGVVGYGLIVTARDQTFISDVKTLIDQLRTEHAVVIGTVMNKG